MCINIYICSEFTSSYLRSSVYSIRAFKVSNEHYLLSSGRDGVLYVWQFLTSKLSRKWIAGSEAIFALSTLVLDDIRAMRVICRTLVSKASSTVQSVQASRMLGHLLQDSASSLVIIASGGGDTLVQVWIMPATFLSSHSSQLNNTDRPVEPCSFPLSFHADAVTAIAMTKGFPWLLFSGGRDHRIAVWDLLTGALLHVVPVASVSTLSIIPNLSSPFHSKSYSRNRSHALRNDTTLSRRMGRTESNELLICSGSDHTTRVWDVDDIYQAIELERRLSFETFVDDVSHRYAVVSYTGFDVYSVTKTNSENVFQVTNNPVIVVFLCIDLCCLINAFV